MRIAIIGAGISGIAAAHILTKCGHEVVVFEKSNELGGIWALAYPGVKLQNTRREYHLSDMPWRIKPDLHPSGAQIRDYLNQTAVSLQLDIRKGHEVLALIECDTGWRLKYHDTEGDHEEEFSFVLVAVGQYTEGKHKPRFPGQEKFKGQVLTERDVKDLDVFDNKNTVIVGFGKSAVDMTTFAAKGARQVYHVFRTPRWMIPFYMLGIHYAKIMFCRMGTMIIPAWAYPSRVERVLHEKLSFIVKGCWKLIEGIISLQCKLHARGLGKEALTRLKTILPTHPMVRDLRSAAAMSPEDYFPYIAEGKILPIQSELEGFTENGLKLKDGSILECDQVVLCLGSEAPSFPFLEDKYRQILEAEIDGIQLYRHLLHPRIPNLAFAGFNHGFMHVPSVEVAMLWLSALLNNEIQLPSVEKMEQSMSRVLEWKRQNINFEPSRSCAVNTRFQQYIDIMLKDLGVSPYRKMPNVFAELFVQYGASDYKDVFEDYRGSRKNTESPREVMSLDT